MYQERFENLFRVAKKVTSCLNIGDILEIIRDEVKIIIPHAKEACLLLVDPEAPSYTRPLHCTMEHRNVNCHMCKRGRQIVEQALGEPLTFHCSIDPDNPGMPAPHGCTSDICEIALPIYDGVHPLAVLNVVTDKGFLLDEKDVVMLTDLADLATNSLINAKKYAKMSREKLTLERILGHIRPFVPETVQRIVERDPDFPALGRRQIDVSILFLDVADYTRISENLNQDKVNFIIEKYFSSFLDAIYTHDGDVNETAGDGLMAIFQGDGDSHVLNAVGAALEIRQRARKINEELKGLFYPIVVNMAVNSGMASVGANRFRGESGARTTFTASGPVTNLAARLAAAATEGDILIGPDTASRIKNTVTLFDRGHMNFKNITGKVHVFSLVPSAA